MLERTFIFLTAGIFLAAGLLGVLSFRIPSQPPVALITPPAPIDLGPIEQGRKIAFTFRVANTTGEAVRIVKLTPSCGCTYLDDVRGASIGTGEVLPIRGTLDTTDRRGRTESHAVLTYRPNTDREGRGPSRDIVLTVRADVLPIVRVSPEPILFDLGSDITDALTKTVDLDSDRLDSFTLVEALPSASWVTARIVEREFRQDAARPQAAKLQVAVDPTGLSNGSERAATNPWIRLVVRGESTMVLFVPIRLRQP